MEGTWTIYGGYMEDVGGWRIEDRWLVDGGYVEAS